MKIELRCHVDAESFYFRGGAGVIVPDPFIKCFEPMRLTHYPELGLGELEAGSESARIVMKSRADAAKEMAEELTKLILAEMKSKDTLDGYAIDPQAQEVD